MSEGKSLVDLHKAFRQELLSGGRNSVGFQVLLLPEKVDLAGSHPRGIDLLSVSGIASGAKSSLHSAHGAFSEIVAAALCKSVPGSHLDKVRWPFSVGAFVIAGDSKGESDVASLFADLPEDRVLRKSSGDDSSVKHGSLLKSFSPSIYAAIG